MTCVQLMDGAISRGQCWFVGQFRLSVSVGVRLVNHYQIAAGVVESGHRLRSMPLGSGTELDTEFRQSLILLRYVIDKERS